MKWMKGYLAAALLQIFLLCACSETPQKAADFDERFDMKFNEVSFRARLAIADFEQAQGLMHIKELPENEGMLFVYETPRKMSFWMKNTNIPLDIAFLDSSLKILEIKKLYPHNLDSVPSSSSNALHALEMNAGWFAKNGISAGAKLDEKLFKKALERRKNND